MKQDNKNEVKNLHIKLLQTGITYYYLLYNKNEVKNLHIKLLQTVSVILVLLKESLHSLLMYLSKHSLLTNLDSGTIPNVIAATNKTPSN